MMSTGWRKPYQWVEIPETVYERRRALRVRESKQTAIAWDRKYFNIDTGKFCLDKMPAIQARFDEALSIGDYNETWLDKPKRVDNSNRWFYPKDDDFDEECRRDEVIQQQVPTIPKIPETGKQEMSNVWSNGRRLTMTEALTLTDKMRLAGVKEFTADDRCSKGWLEGMVTKKR